VLVNLGNVYSHIGMVDKAIDNFTLALSMRGKMSDTNLAATLINLADLLIKQGKLEEAMDHLDEAIAILRRVHGEKSAHVAQALTEVGEIYRRQGKFDESEKVQNKALRYLRRGLGNGHIYVAMSLVQLAAVHMHRTREQWSEALVLLNEAAGIKCGSLGDEHPDLGYIYHNMATCKGQLRDIAGALASVREAHRIFSIFCTSDSIEVQDAAAAVGRYEAFQASE
jgi:tetratricopeptide (TPR) repeat protein